MTDREAMVRLVEVVQSWRNGSVFGAEMDVALEELAAELREEARDDPLDARYYACSECGTIGHCFLDRKKGLLCEACAMAAAEQECASMIRRMLKRIGNLGRKDADDKPAPGPMKLIYCDDCDHWRFAGTWTQRFCLPQEIGDCSKHGARRPRRSVVCDQFCMGTDDEQADLDDQLNPDKEC